MNSSERMTKIPSHLGESAIHDEPVPSRRRCRPLHSHCSAASITYCLLLASAASSTLVLAADDSIKTASSPPRLRNSRALSAKFCPGDYSGKAPTNKCAGYLVCKNGEADSTVQPCASGTQFDVRSGTCTWPDSVTCKTGDALLVQLGQANGGGDGGNKDDDGGKEEVSQFCPPRFTGRAPTTKCRGYVDCKNGKEGLSANCPPNSLFNMMDEQCQFDLDECQMMGDDDDPTDDREKYEYVNELDSFCPPDYNGRAPTRNCLGYVDCKNGKAKRSKMCALNTKFDVMQMACTYSVTGCDALAGPEPTRPPVSKMELQADVPATGSSSSEDVEPEPLGCPEGHTGHLALPGCKEYIYCSGGQELQRIKCGANTLYYAAGGYCNWAYQVTCDTTSAPSRSPVENPTYSPTVQPTMSPVELDMDGQIYYPKFNTGTCSGDGNFPPEVGRQYLFATAERCCETYFEMNMERCVQATMPTPPPTPAGGREWYPDYTNGVCKNDGDAGVWETNFFFTYEECCEFEWLNTVACMRRAPVIAFYPDYETNSCKNDGEQSPFESNIFGSLEECCRFDWIDYGLCITGGSGGDGSDTDEDDNDSGAQEELDDGMNYYPDYTNNICHCDGKQSEFEINIFSTYDACCQFSLIRTNICRQRKTFQMSRCVAPMATQAEGEPTKPKSPPSKPLTKEDLIWYPDMKEGLCRDDGNEPKGILLTVSYEICCKRFMNLNQQKCLENSKEGSVTLTTVENPCPGFKKAGKCNRDSLCEWDVGRDRCVRLSTPNPTRVPTQAPTRRPPQPTITGADDLCQGFNRAGKCNRESQCQWDGSDGRCIRLMTPNPTDASTVPPAKHPVVNVNDDACSGKNKKECLKAGDRCTFNKGTDTCHGIPTSSPVRFPYYPDKILSICRNDGMHMEGIDGDELYDDYEACCSNIWLTKKTCIKHATGRWKIDGMSGGSGGDVQSGRKGDGGNVSNLYYPDYFYNVCRNDGQQSPSEENLFGTMEECCEGVKYIDTDSCMSNAGS
mmetsp:Transcript_24714/g.51710  ORF Transcript_24714/g.51710 Transcript_24714/m.51710 type:complete len:1016 (+) Transcript_24714:157-3204(+)